MLPSSLAVLRSLVQSASAGELAALRQRLRLVLDDLSAAALVHV
jgi:hypothetical protein